MSKRVLTVFSLMVFGLVAGAFLARVQFGEHQPSSLPDYGALPDFVLESSQGGEFQMTSMIGKVWLLNFFFTSCPAVCPAVMGRVSLIERSLHDPLNFGVVSVTVDPDNDTPEALEEYRAKLKLDPESWILARGSFEEIRVLRSETLKLDTGTSIEDHSTRVMLIDRIGRIRGFYQGVQDEAMKELVRDAQILVGEGL